MLEMAMERHQSFVVNGGIKMPIGYRFCPTDEELLIHYLKKRAFGQQLPCSVISDFDVFHTEPWGLPGDLKEKRYFFSNRKGGNIMSKRLAGAGCWRSTGKEKQIVASEGNQVIGMRKTLIFWKGVKTKRSHETRRTQWVMHELRLVSSGVASYPSQVSWADFVVYRVFQNKKQQLKTKKPNQKLSRSRKVGRLDENKANFMEFTVEFDGDSGPPPPCSPSRF